MNHLEVEEDGWDRGFEDVRLRQLRWGLSLTPCERLAWLERTNAEMRRLLGKARFGKANR